ncbi:MAG: hypothetical protein EOO38_19255 [Cytophagaceae bacterium]|nr:MAG: hypothetical protein EOO38_19255 [Cytophagaceae bacterium]
MIPIKLNKSPSELNDTAILIRFIKIGLAEKIGRFVLAETSEIRHVDCHRAEQADYDVQTSERRVSRVHVVGFNLELASDKGAATANVISIGISCMQASAEHCGAGIIAYPFVTMTAHKNKARNVGGTTTPFTLNSTRSFEIGMSERPV